MSPDQWRDQLLSSSARETREQEADFLRLVDIVHDRVTPHVANALLATFSDSADFGTQERVCSVLAGAPVDTRVRAILEKLPRLDSEAAGWAEVLMGELVEHDLIALKRHLHFAAAEIRFAVRGLLSHPESCEIHPEAKSLRGYCIGGAG